MGRLFRYWFYSTTLDDLREDIESDRIDFTRFPKIIHPGETFYRLVDRNEDPLRPSGRKGRFVSEPDNFPFEGYQRAYYQELWKSMPVLGTGAFTMSFSPLTPVREVRMPQDKDFYALTLTKDITVLDFESLRQSMRISFDSSKERHPVYQLFYGKKLKGVVFRSAQEDTVSYYPGGQQPEYNLLIFADWLEGFKSYFSARKIDDNERDSLIGWRTFSQNSLNLCQSQDSANK
ncbi:MAG: hypothetical protein US89_C0022G0006 [Candidatus Peregrinibacteria bacterium GW2011_GWF2_38_29]|nr:MAG: hypothetical protein US89_C0022G0006 [Candidatus Peregrinibacteria bacterium GW2011_GWF2_38_29]